MDFTPQGPETGVEGYVVMIAPDQDRPGYASDDDADIDTGIKPYVDALRSEGFETFESCDGGNGHAYPEPTIRFHGDRSEGMRALAFVQQRGLPVVALRRTWPVIDGEPTGPWWEMTFASVS